MPEASIALKPAALDDLDADARRLLESSVDLANAVEQLLAPIPPEVNPVVVTRDLLAGVQAARDAFLDAAEDVLEVRELPAPAPPPQTASVDRSAGGALGRAGYEEGDLDRVLSTPPGQVPPA